MGGDVWKRAGMDGRGGRDSKFNLDLGRNLGEIWGVCVDPVKCVKVGEACDLFSVSVPVLDLGLLDGELAGLHG
jgi:hypothetical protein